MSIQLKRQGAENAASCSDSPLKPNGLAYGEFAVDSSGYIYSGNGQGEVVSLVRNSDSSSVASTAKKSLYSMDSEALQGKKVGEGIFNSNTEFIPYIHTDGGMEIGVYVDFHEQANSSNDFSTRIQSANNSLYFFDLNGNYSGIYSGPLSISAGTTAASLTLDTKVAENSIRFKNNGNLKWTFGLGVNNQGNDNLYFYSSISNRNVAIVDYRGIQICDKIHLWEDNEGGNISIISGPGDKYYEFDAYNNNLRVYKADYPSYSNIIGVTLLDTNGYSHFNRAYGAVYNDYAEFFPRGEETEPGDIIALDCNSEKEQYIKATINSKKVIGVHSNEYGYLIGGENPPDGMTSEEYNLKNYIPVGLVGRCKVKVIGKVEKGDDIIPTEFPGVGKAVKSNDPLEILNKSIGFAVENSNDENIKLIKVKLKG